MWRILKVMSPKYKWLSLLSIIMTIIQVLIYLLFPNLIASLIAQVGIAGAKDAGILEQGFEVPIIGVITIFCTSIQDAIAKISIILVVSLFIGMLLGTGSAALANYIAVKTAKNLRANLFYHVQGLNAKRINQISQSKLLTTFTSDIMRIQDGIGMSLRTMILGPIFFLGGLIMALMTNLTFSISFAVLIPLLIAIAGFVAWKGIPFFKKQQLATDGINLESQENISGIKVIKSFNLETNQFLKYKKANEVWLGVTTKGNLIQNLTMPVVMLLINICTIIILAIAGDRRPDLSKITNPAQIQAEINNYVRFLTSVNSFIGYLWTVSNGLIMSLFVSVFIFRSQVSAKRMWNVMDIQNDLIRDFSNTKEVENGTIEFRNVYFKYWHESPKYVLKNINLTIEKGQTIGIVGPTGSGKSTLVKLISHDYDVMSGEVLIDSQDIKKYNPTNLNKAISHVYQKPFLLSGSVRSNMLFANKEASDEQIDHALKIAGAYDFVHGFSDGFEHPVSQGATNLSGGQRQRLFIAQAVMKNPKIIIFDDSTSALDNKTDKLVRTNIKKEFSNLTTLIISQKISSVVDCDKIIVIEDGEITGFDTHEKLIETNKYYREVVQTQLGDE